jgi:hypothetical protein
MSEEFYVGYQPKAPDRLARAMRRAVSGLFAVGLLVCAILIAGQAPFAASSFEFRKYRDYEGDLINWPYPMLLAGHHRYLLVLPGKHGAVEETHGLDGKRVRLRAALIRRGPDRMLELDPGSLTAIGVGRPADAPRDLGPVTLTGEIVDTKCHLGVMNPGNGHVHRDCAVRCISGGAPPGFLVRDAHGETQLLLLAGGDGRQLGREVLNFVAEPVSIRGRLVRSGATLILKAEPRDFRRE